MKADELTGYDMPMGTAFEVVGSAQRGQWLTQQLDPASPAYLLSHAFELRGPLDIDALAESLRLLVARHETLRTTFVRHDDTLLQVIHPPVEELLEVAEPEGDVEAAVAVERMRPFDLTRPPLIRARLWPTGPSHHVLTVTLHHIAADGESMAILWRELTELYSALAAGRGMPDLPDLALHYADYAAWEHEWLRSDEYRRQFDHWMERLADLPDAVDLPRSAQAQSGPHWRGGTLRLVLSTAETAGLMKLVSEHRVTPFVALLLVYSGVLHRWSGQSDVVVGAPVSLRDQPGMEHLVGMFVNVVPIPIHWEDNPDLAEAFRRARTAAGEALAGKRVPLDHLARAVPRAREPGRSPLVQVAFAYDHVTDPASTGLRLPGIVVTARGQVTGSAKFDLSLDCVLSEGRLHCGFEWSDQRFDASLVALFAEHFHVATRHVIDHPTSQVGDWPLHVAPPSPPEARALIEDDLVGGPWES